MTCAMCLTWAKQNADGIEQKDYYYITQHGGELSSASSPNNSLRRSSSL